MKGEYSVQVGLFIITLVLLILASTGCATITTNEIAYKRKLDYTSASDVAKLMTMYEANMVDDTLIRFLVSWSNNKYELYKRGGTVPTDAVDATIMRIPQGSIGILPFGADRLILTARAYPMIPSDDDEIQIVDALDVPPGKIAWRLTPTGERVILTAKEGYYDFPANEWVVEDHLWIREDQMAYRLGLEGYQFKGPGIYNGEPVSDWVVTNAIVIPPNWFGVSLHQDGELVFLNPGTYYSEVPSMVRIYPEGQQRYRTLSESIIENPDGSLCNNVECPACASALCEYTVSRVVVRDLPVGAHMDGDVLFHLVSSDVSEYRYVGDFMRLVQDNVATPFRNHARSACSSQFTRLDLRTQEGKQECAGLIKELMIGDASGSPVVIDEVSIRGIDFHDDSLQQADLEAQTQEVEAQGRERVARAMMEAVAAEQELTALQIAANVATDDAEMELLQRRLEIVAESGLSPEHLWVLLESGLIDMELRPDGTMGILEEVPMIQLAPTPTVTAQTE